MVPDVAFREVPFPSWKQRQGLEEERLQDENALSLSAFSVDSYETNSVKLEDKDKNLKRRMCREFVEKCRPGGPTYCNDAPLTNAGTPKRFD